VIAQEFTKFDGAKTADGEHGHCFGISKEATARALRQLADRIDRGLVGVKEATVTTKAVHDDWTYTTLRLELSEAVPKESDGLVKLYGGDSFPMAVAKVGDGAE
jgi:hypothetical protein